MYFNIIVDKSNNSFIVEESSKKAFAFIGSARATLLNIKEILDSNNKFANASQGEYSKLQDKELFAKLDQIAKQIEDGYQTKANKVSRICKWLGGVESKQREIADMYQRIKHLVSPPKVHEILADDVVQHILHFSDVKSLSQFAKVNRAAKKLSEDPFIQRAKKYGYSGSNLEEAKEYLQVIFQGVKNLAHFFQDFTSGSVRYEEILLNAKKHLDELEGIDKVKFQTSLDQALITSVQNLNLANVRALLYVGANPNDIADVKNGSSLLVYMLSRISLRRLEGRLIFQELLKRGANPNLANNFGDAPLHYIEFFASDTLELLLQAGADINARSKKGRTTLSIAIDSRVKKEIIDFLLKNGANPRLVTKKGNNALHSAVMNNRFDLLDDLVKSGVDPTLMNKQGKTCRDLAMDYFASRCPQNEAWQELFKTKIM